ncbi:hypothetical protein N665_0326s0036 [Sinapis alba]|nr:hypothetical protein N665_0326s0036 [Sinapis alba]
MSCYLHTPESRKRNLASHSVAARGSSPVPHLVPNQTVNYVVRNGDTSLFTVPNNKAGLVSTTGTYRSSLSNTMQLRHVKELCSLLVSKSVEVANKMSGANEKDSSLDPSQRDANVINDSPDCVLDDVRKDEKPMSPATGALMCDDEHVNISEKETFAPERTSEEEEDRDTSSEVYLEQERQILSCFKDHLIQLLNRGSIYGRNKHPKSQHRSE